jgi:hypothetical protein
MGRDGRCRPPASASRPAPCLDLLDHLGGDLVDVRADLPDKVRPDDIDGICHGILQLVNGGLRTVID